MMLMPMNESIARTDIYERLGITPAQLSDFCKRWQVAELSFFGSVLRADFTASSDVDVLVAYLPTAKRGLFEKIRMKEDLEALLHRNVDLVSKKAIEQSRNWGINVRRKVFMPIVACHISRWCPFPFGDVTRTTGSGRAVFSAFGLSLSKPITDATYLGLS
jgi:predicted nucleotidyltransferase